MSTVNSPTASGTLRRERVFVLVTLVVAVAWLWGAWRVAEHVKRINFARLVGSAMVGGMAGHPDSQSLLPPLLPLPRPAAPDELEQAGRRHALQEQTRWVETVIYVWRSVMNAVAAVLAILAVVSHVTGRARAVFLAAAAIILASCVVSVVGMLFLVAPERGGLPPLRGLAYVVVVAVQSAYGLVLLAAFARRPGVDADEPASGDAA